MLSIGVQEKQGSNPSREMGAILTAFEKELATIWKSLPQETLIATILDPR